MARNISSPTTKAAPDITVPITGPALSSRRPPSRSTTAPASGRASSSHINVKTPVAGTATAVSAARVIRRSSLVLQQVGFVDRGRPAGAEDRDDDGETDDDLGGRDDHDEERDHLS